jgi:hypothetical protein
MQLVLGKAVFLKFSTLFLVSQTEQPLFQQASERYRYVTLSPFDFRADSISLVSSPPSNR